MILQQMEDGMTEMQTGSKGEKLASDHAVSVLHSEIFNLSGIVGFLVNTVTQSWRGSDFVAETG